MVAISNWDSPVFTRAVLVWTGFGRGVAPQHDDAAVIGCFGAEAASQLLPAIKALVEEYYRSDAKHTAPDLVTMGKLATEEFHAKHPEVADEVLKALAWCYTFDFR
jgi:hypothetical protein